MTADVLAALVAAVPEIPFTDVDAELLLTAIEEDAADQAAA